MPRPRTIRVAEIKKLLVDRTIDPYHQPGQRFMSNRSIARQFKISYQTADILLSELTSEGRLERRASSGTYIPGRQVKSAGVVLIFHPRAKRKSSFGAKLLDCLVAALDRERIDWRMVWTNPADSKRALLVADRYPVIWERPEVVEKLISLQRCALLLNQRPPAGVGSTLIDSISVDDFSGGAGAAQFLLARCPRSTPQFAILSGPVNDPRSSARVAGFLSIAQARVVSAPTWFYDDAKTVAVNVLRAGPDGIFCCNDRLAEAAIRCCNILGMTRPAVVGFDDAPVATWVKLTTVAIPWEGLVAAASSVIRRRMTGAASSAIAQLISTRIIVRD